MLSTKFKMGSSHFPGDDDSMKKVIFAVLLLSASLSGCAQQPASPPATLAELQRVSSAKKPSEIARYIYDNYGCHNCHTVGSAGKFGYTAQGEQLKSKSEGCIS